MGDGKKACVLAGRGRSRKGKGSDREEGIALMDGCFVWEKSKGKVSSEWEGNGRCDLAEIDKWSFEGNMSKRRDERERKRRDARRGIARRVDEPGLSESGIVGDHACW